MLGTTPHVARFFPWREVRPARRRSFLELTAHGLRSEAWFAARRLGPAGRRLGEALLTTLPEHDRLVDSRTDACIDGFPRSANTIAYHAFARANPGTRVAHHLHTPIQVVRAADLGVPCAVTIRPPLEAISSLLVFWRSIDPSRVTVGSAFRRYVDFYMRISDVRDRIVVCRFESVIDDPSIVGRSLNRKFGTDFNAPRLDVQQMGQLTAAIGERHRRRGRALGTYTLPRDEKTRLKAALRPALSTHPRLEEAEAAFAELVG